jgi:hypothetical protein
LQRAVGAMDIQRYHTNGVFPWSRTFPRSPQGTPPTTSWPGALQLRSGLLPPLQQISCMSRLLSSSSFVCRGIAPQMRHSRKKPFHAPIGMPPANQHVGIWQVEIHGHEREGAHTSGVISSISSWFPMTEPCGIDIIAGVHRGAGGLPQGEGTTDTLRIVAYPLALLVI